MAGSGRFLLALALALCLSGAILAAEQEVEDFDFDESDAKVVVKRAAGDVQSDDEDFLADEPGSGPDEEYNGSGEPPPSEAPVFSSRYYRITVTVSSLQYVPALGDRNTVPFQNDAQRLAQALERAVAGEAGEYQLAVVRFEPSASVGSRVTIDLLALGTMTESTVRSTWRRLAAGQLPVAGYTLNDEGFDFKLLGGGPECPDTVGREPERLPGSLNNWANILVNLNFQCNGTIVSWEYYRLSPEGSAFAGVWRLTPSTEFVLISKTELPAAEVGIQEVVLSQPVRVQSGDIIGIFYRRDTPNNLVAMTTQADNLGPGRELYQNYRVQMFEDMIVEGRPINIDNFPFNSVNSSFALRAIMDYPDELQPVTVAPVRCNPDQFSCGDGYCIQDTYRCDGQNDCNNNRDEEECTSCKEDTFLCRADGRCIANDYVCDGESTCSDGSDEANCAPEPCLEGRFRCDDGTCISRIYRCDGTPHCPDGSDEKQSLCNPGTMECAQNEFRCRSGDCIPADQRCNREEDCFDGSDEEDCPRACSTDQFQCNDGSCIDINLKCDSRRDCPDSEDELDCTTSLCDPQTEFTCEDQKQCIPIASRCNDIPDCVDFSDELPDLCQSLVPTGPPACAETSYRCPSGICIEKYRLCDGVDDCFDGSDEASCKCGDNEFRCNDGQCLPEENRCDGYVDCNDLSDEANCPLTCSQAEFTCENGRCISKRDQCNRIDDCGDGSDEAGCPCQAGEHQCGDGRCLDDRSVCDGRRDCRDGSDEANCGRCRRNEFECADGTCVPRLYVCDRNSNCPDSSDEFNCTCNPASEFRCLTNGQCVPQSAVCDQIPDCLDATDESDCGPVGCRAGEFTCRDGSCLDSLRVCDGRRDCRDGSDEDNCAPRTCAPGQFTCDDGQCIASSQRCNRQIDCVDGSDERTCPCGPREFTCVSDGRCLPPGYRCNGNPECRDGSDERDCALECTAGEFACADGTQCVLLSDRCNRRYDCSDGSDEAGCPSQVTRISISPAIMRKRAGTSASFVCMVEGVPGAQVQWTRRTGGAMPRQATITDNRLTIVNLRIEDSGDYRCTVNTATGPVQADARLSVEYVGPSTDRPDPDGPCRRDEASCSNGACIPKDYICDGENDCDDGSDEASCSVSLPCEPNEFRCDNGRCAVKIWRCDGDDDCLDGSDERNCPTSSPSAPCKSHEFTCATGDQCVPLSYQCDGELDCLDRSDERGCIQPSITVPPVPEITVEINGTFNIVCEAVGVPTPLIVWRLNWGNIPSGPRVTVTSEQGRGVLTIRNAVVEDAGAYTCEAINNIGSIFAIPDALIIVRRSQGVCRTPTFNSEALTTDQCVRCFCFGQSQTCLSSNLQYSQITLGNQVALVGRNTLEPALEGVVQYIPVSREFQVDDFNTRLRTGSYYWSLPYQYLSKRISSYGGKLTYNVYYEVEDFDVPTNDPDVIITGNGITISHRSSARFRPRAPTTVTVNLVENEWERSTSSVRTGPITEFASREDMMLVLENVTSLLIRATYDNRQSLIKLGNVLLTTGVPQNTGLGRAVFVEECTCPTGYAGYSCEECAPGFYRVDRGRYGRECVACQCNGHSNECDPMSGICRNCRDNTVGPYCDRCATGFVGDPRSGRPDACQACPCPLTNPENQFSNTCILDGDGDITCTACPDGYEGRNCERCADGYNGNPTVRGQRCIKSDSDRCDNRGSVSDLTDPTTGRCNCKDNVQGRYCNECRANTFYLSEQFPKGCISCFCMGVTQTCQSTTYNRAQIGLQFRSTAEGVTLTDMTRRQTVNQGFRVDRNSRELIFRNFAGIDPAVHYWSLPRQFLGDKVTAYGGDLKFTLRYRPGRDTSPMPMISPVVEIGGNDITLVYRLPNQVDANRPVSFTVPMIESRWLRMDGVPATREHMLMTLADLDFILIRAAYTSETDEAAISSISLDIAENRNTGQERAYAVEQCVCPVGHKGLSCEDCDTGYTRSGGGLYLGLCQPCRCNGHSSECDPETGVCRNCRHNTVGDSCDRCARGYYGDARRGSVNDCQRCPCPLTESPNQFSPDCILDRDDQVTCTACPPGHTGRRCERCEAGYTGNPLQPGDYCKPLNVTCDCDGRGTLPNTVCDPNTQQCQCKNNVQGRRCSTCKPGFFNLDRDNMAGCLKCFCSGITDQCTSSNYYRTQITPIFNSDGSHNFVLTNRRLSRTISDGFSIDAARNAITFSSFDGLGLSRQSLYFNLPPKFRGDQVAAYGGYLRFILSYTTAQDEGKDLYDVDIELVGSQNNRLYYVFRPSPVADTDNTYEILLTEASFRNFQDPQRLSRESFLATLADLDAILIRASYHTAPTSVTLRDLSMDIAGPTPNQQLPALDVERCTCPEGYTGLSCQACAPGYLRVEDPSTPLGRCTRCNCNGHASSCDPVTGECRDCQHNTEGERCERCARGFYGDPTAGTPGDCRVCPCPLTVPSNQFSPSCFLERDNQVTCDRCPTGYTGRNCGQCSPGYVGNPLVPGEKCERDIGQRPEVQVNPVSMTEPLGSTVIFQCLPSGRGPFTVLWSRLDARPLPSKVTTGPGPNFLLTIPDVQYSDSARYVCTVNDPYGSNRAFASLSVERPDRPIRIRIEEPTNFVGRRGMTARFTCIKVQSSSDNYLLAWSRENGRPMPAKAIDQGGVLVIPDIQESDVGTYTCIGSEATSEDKASATLSIGDLSEPPSVRIEPRFKRVNEGDRVEFRCVANGSPAPTVTWTKGKTGPLPSYVYTDETGVMRIESASYADQAEYYCTAQNSEGISTIRTIIYVQRTERVRILVRRANVTAIVGEDTQLTCFSEGGDATLTWSKDRDRLPAGATQENGVLVLPNIQRNSGGIYYCTGTSPTDGSVLGRVSIRVTVRGTAYSRPTARMEPDRQIVGAGMTATVRCIVTGEPAPEVVWSRANGELSSNHQVNGNILRISQATMDDRGIYVCTATNTEGRVQTSAIVDVERRSQPVIELHPQQSITANQGDNVSFMCRVMGGEPRPTISWTRSNGDRITERTSIMTDNGVIQFRGVTTEDQGEYICSATNDVGTVTATASLRVMGPPSIRITPGNRITSVIGERVNIECVGVGDPTPNVYWRSGQRRRSDVLPEAFAPTPGTARLLFESVSRGDAGRYICIASSQSGNTEQTVDLIVEESGQPTVAIDGPEQLTVSVGGPVQLTCSSKGVPDARITWSRAGRAPLPPDHSVIDGTLVIPRMEAEYSGEYICTVTSRSGALGPDASFRSSIYIIVTVTPRVVVSPSRVSTTTGQAIRLTCRPDTPGRVNIEWTRVDGGQMSALARERNGVLEIRQASRADSGRYRCVITGQTGTSEGFVDVTVLSPPSISITPQTARVAIGDTIEMNCNVQGDPQPQIKWEREIGDFPPQHTIRNGLLVLYNVQPADSGRYICSAFNSAGTAKEYAFLQVEGEEILPTRPVTNVVTVGETVEFECIINPPGPANWSKVEGALPNRAILSANTLIIPDVRLEDAGTYSCKGGPVSGTVITSIRLFVEESSFPVLGNQQEDYATAALGSPAQLKCDAQAMPQARVSWVKQEGDLPDNHYIRDGMLHIPRVREEDEGRYECQVRGDFGQAVYPVVLVVGALVPYFQQNPNSYMSFKSLSLSDVYHELDVALSFRPESTDGLLLYNGQYTTASGDYVCFGMQGQYPEFRFDAGSGPAIITGTRPLALNKWHTVHLLRNRTDGTMMINDEPAYVGAAPGTFHGMDIVEPMYLGGVPDVNALPRSARFNGGFVGGVSEVKINGVSVNLGAEAREIVNVDQYDVCRDSPCLNGGACRPHNTRYGYVCECPRGWRGDRCQFQGMRCYPGACGVQGRCFNHAGDDGFSCICPIGFEGEGCVNQIEIIDPAFDKTSFISYPTISNGLLKVNINLKFKPRSLDDGIILYNAQRQDGVQDFIALVIIDRYLEFRFDTGSGLLAVRSQEPLRVNQWTEVQANRTGNTATLVINRGEPITKQAEASREELIRFSDRGDVNRGSLTGDNTVGLNLAEPLFLGGVDPLMVINPLVGTTQGFTGCIGEMTIGDTLIDLIGTAESSVNVQDCGDRSLCERRPCKNGGACIDVSPTEYICNCPSNFVGPDCSTPVSICSNNNPCRGRSQCVPIGDSYRCECPVGRTGVNCEKEYRTLGSDVEFQGRGYLELPKKAFPHKRRKSEERLNISFTTGEKDGLLFWQGQLPGEQGGKDYFAVSLKDGYLEFSYQLGSGPSLIRSNRRLDDRRRHTVVLTRVGKKGTIQVDNEPVVEGMSQKNLHVLNVQGNVFIGGVPILEKYTGGLFTERFNGCIHNLSIQGNQVDFNNLGTDIIGGINVRPCSL